jgi:N-acetylneuraminic acid mutarotase
MPAGTERAGSCVATLGSKIYVFGGGTDGEATTFASVYDVVQDSWAELPALIHSREHCSAFASNGKLYILGGRTHSIPEFRSPSLEFDPETKKYTDKTPIPTPRGGAASAVIDGRLFLFGGEGSAENGGVFDEVEAYDAQQDAWESFPSLLVPRHGYGAAYIDGRVYLSGGATKQGGAASDVNTVYYFE